MIEDCMGGVSQKCIYQNQSFDIGRNLTVISDHETSKIGDALTFLGKLYGWAGFDPWV